MRIANKGFPAFALAAALIVAPCLLAFNGMARAADAPGPTPPPVAQMNPQAAPALPPPATPIPAKTASVPPSATLTGHDASQAASQEIAKSLASAEDRATEDAKGVVKKLDSASDTTTLEDLNAARQAVARLKAMIDVEKNLSELEKARDERSGSHSFASAIPASALIPPMPVAPVASRPIMPSIMPSPVREPEPVPHFSMSTEVVRIAGIDGRYVATLKVGGQTRAVRVGDYISGNSASGGVVRAITPSVVEIEENGATHSLHVKNVDVIYSAMR